MVKRKTCGNSNYEVNTRRLLGCRGPPADENSREDEDPRQWEGTPVSENYVYDPKRAPVVRYSQYGHKSITRPC